MDRTKAVVWNDSNKAILLPELEGHRDGSAAVAISSNGNVVVGTAWSKVPERVQAVCWLFGPIAEGLGFPAGYDQTSAVAVNSDGTILAANARNTGDAGSQAFRWLEGKGWEALGFLPEIPRPPLPPYSEAVAMSADGSVIVGMSNGAIFRWTKRDGMKPLHSLLREFGLDPNPWGFGPETKVKGISTDGTRIIGAGVLNGMNGGFVATLPR